MKNAIRRLRELHEAPPEPIRLPTAAEVDAAQKSLGVTFHPDYRRYLLEASDVDCGFLEPCTITAPDAHTNLLDVANAAWEESDVPRELLPICEDDGAHYCMNAAGEVVLWSSEGEIDETWPNLATWIQKVRIEED